MTYPHDNLETRRKWQKSNGEHLRKYMRDWRKSHPNYSRIFHRLKNEQKFGVRYPTWWLCDICSKPISLYKSEIHLDHDHITGKFRAWLCFHCNRKLGWVDRYWERVRRLKEELYEQQNNQGKLKIED